MSLTEREDPLAFKLCVLEGRTEYDGESLASRLGDRLCSRRAGGLRVRLRGDLERLACLRTGDLECSRLRCGTYESEEGISERRSGLGSRNGEDLLGDNARWIPAMCLSLWSERSLLRLSL